MNNDHVSLYSEETNAEKSARLVVHLFRIVPHIHSTRFSTLYMGKRSANAVKSASIEEKQRLVKYRRIDRSIILTLKRFYDYRDEISGEKIGDEYGDSVVEAHHIDYFTRSQNNDSTNIIIINPNYHQIIHKNNLRLNRKKFQFEFENGEVLRLKLYEHLMV